MEVEYTSLLLLNVCHAFLVILFFGFWFLGLNPGSPVCWVGAVPQRYISRHLFILFCGWVLLSCCDWPWIYDPPTLASREVGT